MKGKAWVSDMNLLAIESSGRVASAAVIREGRLIAEYTLDNGLTHSQTLLPMIDEIMKASKTEKESLDAIAISKGPGSFTGLRIGSATAKGLGLALNIPLIEVSTLMGLAYNLKECTDRLVCPIIDSRRREVYGAIYRFIPDNGGYACKCVMEDSAMTLEAFIGKLNEMNLPCIFTGDGVEAYGDYIKENIRCDYLLASGRNLIANAGAVAAVAAVMYEKGITVSADEHSPEYLRLSQAERELMEKNKGL